MTLYEDVVLAIAGHGVLGARNPFPTAPLTDEAFDRLLKQLMTHRLLGLAVSAVGAGRLPVTDDQADQLLASGTDSMCACLRLEATLLDVHDALQSNAIDMRVIKGPASAHLDYADPSLRAFGDLDVLVPSESFDDAVVVLGALGFRREVPQIRDGFDRRFGKGATFTGVADGMSVDLHRTFVMGPLGLSVDQGQLWTGVEHFSLAGRAIPALPPTQRLLAACYNAVLGDAVPRLSTIRDVAQLVLSGDIVAAEAVEMARDWRAAHVLALGVSTTWHHLDIADVVGLSTWAENYLLSRDEQRSLHLYHDSGVGYSGLAWAVARMLPMRDRMAFLRALAFPDGGRLGADGWGLAQRVRRAARGYVRSSR